MPRAYWLPVADVGHRKLWKAWDYTPTLSTEEVYTMGNQHSSLLDAVVEERERILSRRALLGGGLKLGGAAALTLGLAGTLPVSRLSALAQDVALKIGRAHV